MRDEIELYSSLMHLIKGDVPAEVKDKLIHDHVKSGEFFRTQVALPQPLPEVRSAEDVWVDIWKELDSCIAVKMAQFEVFVEDLIFSSPYVPYTDSYCPGWNTRFHDLHRRWNHHECQASCRTCPKYMKDLGRYIHNENGRK